MLEKLKSLGLTWKFGGLVFISLVLVIIVDLSILRASLNSRLDALYGSPKATSVFVAELLADELGPFFKKDVNALDIQQQMQDVVDSYYQTVQGIYSVHYLLVQDPSSTVLSDTFKDMAPGWLVTKNPIDGKAHCELFKTQGSSGENIYYDCAIPVKMGKIGVGAVRAGVLQRDADEVYAKRIKIEHVSRVFTPVMITTILLIVLLTAGLTAAFWFFVIRRILFLTEFTEKMSFGELEVEIPMQSDDEIGHLEETLERMRVNLREAIERLKDRLKRR